MEATRPRRGRSRIELAADAAERPVQLGDPHLSALEGSEHCARVSMNSWPFTVRHTEKSSDRKRHLSDCDAIDAPVLGVHTFNSAPPICRGRPGATATFCPLKSHQRGCATESDKVRSARPASLLAESFGTSTDYPVGGPIGRFKDSIGRMRSPSRHLILRS